MHTVSYNVCIVNKEVTRMSFKETIIKLAKKNNGVLTRKEVISEGIHNEYLRLLVKDGYLEKTSRGQYALKDSLVDEMFLLQKRYSKGIYSFESALFLLGFSDRTPQELVMTFPRKYNTTSISKNGIKTYRVDEKHYYLGITSINTQFNNLVKVYCIERTLCDLLRPNCKTSIEVVLDAFKQYGRTKNKQINTLMDFAKVFNVEEKVRNYLEVLL